MSRQSDFSSVPDFATTLSEYIKQEPLDPQPEGTWLDSFMWPRQHHASTQEEIAVKLEVLPLDERTSKREFDFSKEQSLSRWPFNTQLSEESEDTLHDELEKLEGMCRQVAASDVQCALTQLNIPHNPRSWVPSNVQTWLAWLINEGKLHCPLDSLQSLMKLSGPELIAYCEEQRDCQVVPYELTDNYEVQSRTIIAAHLDIWISAAQDISSAYNPSLPCAYEREGPNCRIEETSSPCAEFGPDTQMRTVLQRGSSSLDARLPLNVHGTQDSSSESLHGQNYPELADYSDCPSVYEQFHTDNFPSTEAELLLYRKRSSSTGTSLYTDDETSLRSWPSSPRSSLSPLSSPPPSSTDCTVTARRNSSHIHLWQFLRELLADPRHQGTIRWLDRSRKIFKIEDSNMVAKMWGRRKNRPAMNYDKLSRSIRQYYRKGIMKKTERSQRLVYQFCSI